MWSNIDANICLYTVLYITLPITATLSVLCLFSNAKKDSCEPLYQYACDAIPNKLNRLNGRSNANVHMVQCQLLPEEQRPHVGVTSGRGTPLILAILCSTVSAAARSPLSTSQ